MLIRLLLVTVVALSQFGCGVRFDTPPPSELRKDSREWFESRKREFLKIEDLKIGDGPLAAWNRRIEADLEVRYADGTLIYRGPVFYYAGFATMPDNSVYDESALTISQEGIRLGLNGMAVGGKRRMTVDPTLVCQGARGGANPKYSCYLVGFGTKRHGTEVRKETLIVEATLTESCIPTELQMFVWKIFAWTGEVICLDQDTPKRSPTDPIWRFY